MERIPILKMGPFLLVTIQVDMHDQLAITLQDDLTTKIAKERSRGVLIDISALDVVDSFIGRMIANISGDGARARRARRSWSACSRRSPSRWSSWACRWRACRPRSTSRRAWRCCSRRLETRA